MSVVNLTINGQKFQAQSGQTVLQAARNAGIDIPTLCDHPALRPEAVCRICVVEVERQRVLQPACAFPVAEGMAIWTDSERVVAARRMVLQLLFSQRLHYCMYCVESGGAEDAECELQRLAYRYGLTSWRIAPNTLRRWPVDASRRHFIMDHNRCIMCRRCVRACHEIVANHTLSIGGRGARAMIIADDDVPFGESSCVSCGTCLQVCPTGALIDRRSAYMGTGPRLERTATTCMACPVGCGIKAVIRSRLLHRIEGDWAAANGGLLCVDGRFEALEHPSRRVSAPRVRRSGHLVETSWDDALAEAAQNLRKAKTVAGLLSPRETNEAMAAYRRLLGDILKSKQFGLLKAALPPLNLGAPATLPDLPSADCIVVVGGDPCTDQKVLGYLTRRAVDRGAVLVVAHDRPTSLDRYARMTVGLADLALVEGVVQSARRPVVLYGPGWEPTVYATLKALPATARLLPLVKGTNSMGAARLGLSPKDVHGDALFILLGDDTPPAGELPQATFTVIQAAYHNPWTEQADVVLPAQVWTEKNGHIVTVEGRELAVVPCTDMPKTHLADEVVLDMMAAQLAKAKTAKPGPAVAA